MQAYILPKIFHSFLDHQSTAYMSQVPMKHQMVPTLLSSRSLPPPPTILISPYFQIALFSPLNPPLQRTHFIFHSLFRLQIILIKQTTTTQFTSATPQISFFSINLSFTSRIPANFYMNQMFLKLTFLFIILQMIKFLPLIKKEQILNLTSAQQFKQNFTVNDASSLLSHQQLHLSALKNNFKTLPRQRKNIPRKTFDSTNRKDIVELVELKDLIKKYKKHKQEKAIIKGEFYEQFFQKITEIIKQYFNFDEKLADEINTILLESVFYFERSELKPITTVLCLNQTHESSILIKQLEQIPSAKRCYHEIVHEEYEKWKQEKDQTDRIIVNCNEKIKDFQSKLCERLNLQEIKQINTIRLSQIEYKKLFQLHLEKVVSDFYKIVKKLYFGEEKNNKSNFIFEALLKKLHEKHKFSLMKQKDAQLK